METIQNMMMSGRELSNGHSGIGADLLYAKKRSSS